MDTAAAGEESLTDSWVEVQYGSESEDAMINSTSSVISSGSIQTLSTTPPLSLFNGSTGEKYGRLKLEIPQQMNQQQIDDFIWDWSSRPEVVPPSGYVSRLKRPPKRHISDTSIHEEEPPAKWFSWVNLPRLIFTNACSFIVGATIMFLALKKYSQSHFVRRFVQL